MNRLFVKPTCAKACVLSLILAAGVAEAAPFVCTGDAFIVQEISAQLTVIDQAVSPFVFVPIGGPAGFQINGIGFNRNDGLIWGWHRVRIDPMVDPLPQEVVTIDDTGTVTPMGQGGLPDLFFNTGDVSDDGLTMYLNESGAGPLWSITLPGLTGASSVMIAGDTGTVADWAFNRTDSMLWGGDHSDGQIASVIPATGARADFSVAGCAVISPTCNAASLPSGGSPTIQGYGAAWFNAAGNLFLLQNNGVIFEIGDVTTSPIIVSTQTGPASDFNDGAACVHDVLGAAKQMISSNLSSLPSTITITYTFEAFAQAMNDVSAIDDLEAVFGTHGVDWTFTMISSSANIAHNAGFNGHTDTELIDQTMGTEQDLAIGSPATVTVVLELLTLDGGTDMNGEFCNQVLVTGIGASDGFSYGDLSTDGLNPDPDNDDNPDERVPSCFGTQVPVELTTFSVE